MSQWSKQLKVQRYLFSNCPNVQDKWNGDSPVDTIKVHPKNDKPVGGPLRFQIFFCNLFNYFPSTCLKIIFQIICYCCYNWRGLGWSNVWVTFCTQIASSLTSSTWGLWIHFGLYWNHKKTDHPLLDLIIFLIFAFAHLSMTWQDQFDLSKGSKLSQPGFSFSPLGRGCMQ